MIILNSEKINNNFKEILKKYNNMTNLPYLECAYCGSSSLIKYGTYKRNVCYIDNNKLVNNTIDIKRVICKECGHTHALIPSFIIPYKISLLDVILSGIKDEELTICISFDTINCWNKEFNKFLPYIKTMLKEKDKNEIINKLKEDINDIYKRFYVQYKKIFMMIRPGIYNMVPF